MRTRFVICDLAAPIRIPPVKEAGLAISDVLGLPNVTLNIRLLGFGLWILVLLISR